MHLPDEKLELLKALIDTDDEELLRQLQDALDHDDYDFRNDFPDFLKANPATATVAENQEFLAAHQELMKKYFEYL